MIMTIALLGTISPLIFESKPNVALNRIFVKAVSRVCHQAKINRETLTVNEAMKRVEEELKVFVIAIINLLKDPEMTDIIPAAKWIRNLAHESESTSFCSISTYTRDKLLLFAYYNLDPTHPLYPNADDFLWLGRNSPVGC